MVGRLRVDLAVEMAPELAAGTGTGFDDAVAVAVADADAADADAVADAVADADAVAVAVYRARPLQPTDCSWERADLAAPGHCNSRDSTCYSCRWLMWLQRVAE